MIAPASDRLAARRSAFAAALRAAGLSGAFLRESADVEYLVGMPRAAHDTEEAWDREILVEGCWLGLDGSAVILVTRSEWALHAHVAAALGHDVRVVAPGADPVAALRDAARSVGAVGDLGVSDRLGLTRQQLLRDACPDARLVAAGPLVWPLRMRKDDGELASIRAAGVIADAALTASLPAFAHAGGVREAIVELEHQLLLAGSEALPYRPGVHAAGPGTDVRWCERPAGTSFVAPCAVSVDLIAVRDGYRADIGRTVFIGEPPPGAESALAACRAAVRAGADVLRDGVAAGTADRAARAVMATAGLADAFTIPAGHGLGLELHEPPRLREDVTDPVPAGCVVTVEVAAWRDGELSAFWEEDLAVGAGAPEFLTRGPDSAPVVS